MQNAVMPCIAMFAVPVSMFAGNLPQARAATLLQCAQNHAVCHGQCVTQYVPQNPALEPCKVGCAQSRVSCDMSASDRKAAPPPAHKARRTPDTAVPGPQPSLLERDAAPAGVSPAPAGRPAGAPGAGGPQFK